MPAPLRAVLSVLAALSLLVAMPQDGLAKKKRHRRAGCSKFCRQAGGFGAGPQTKMPVRIPRQTIRPDDGLIGIRARCTLEHRCVGAILVTIGRVLNVITIIADAVAAASGIGLTVCAAIQLKNTTDPYKRAEIARQMISDSNKAFSNVANLVLASGAVGKIIGKGAGKLGAGLAFVTSGTVTRPRCGRSATRPATASRSR